MSSMTQLKAGGEGEKMGYMENNEGKPKTLTSSIGAGLTPVVTQPGTMNFPQAVFNIQIHVRDFLAQKFAIALLRHGAPEAESAIWDLWKELTGEEYK